MADNSNSNYKTTQYFASDSSRKCASVLMDKGQSYFNALRANSFLDKIIKQWQAYHGVYYNDMNYSHEIGFSGEQGELVTLPVKQYRNIADHMFYMITATRPTMQARAINTDYKSLAQTYLADGILDYYMRERKLEDAIKEATKMAIVLGAGFIKLEWNATSGEIYDTDPDTDEPVYEGDVEFTVLSPLDVVVDGTKESWNNEWILVRSYQNKYNLMAKYPELAEKIDGIPTKSDINSYRFALFSNDKTDDIPVYEFYHKKTDAMPDGRYMLFVNEDIVLLDTKMPYATLPVFRIVPSNILGTPYGYTPMFDIFPIQEGINSLYSAIMTNQSALAVQNIFVDRDADLNVKSLDGAMNIIEGKMKPEALNLTQTPKEVFEFLNMLIQSAETISGVNSVARGNPEASLKSGTALALVQSQALQFISGLQQSYVKLIEDVGTSVIRMLKDFASTPRVIAIVGKNNRPLLKEFIGDDLNQVNRIVVDMGNPLSRTTAGRVQMAEQMLQMKLIKNPQQYFQVVNTGRLDSMYEGDMMELLLVKSENEQLLEGKEVQAALLDAHRMHILEHKSVLADPELRKNPELVKLALGHIQQHIDYLRNADPDLLQLVGEQPLNPPQQQGQPELPPGPMGPDGSAPEGSQGPQNPMPQQGGQPVGEPIRLADGSMQNLPSMPQVPAELLPNPDLQQQSMGNVK